MAKTLSQLYAEKGKALLPPSQRFNDPDFAAAAAAAGVTKDQYVAAGSSNAELNNKISAAFEKGGMQGTMTAPTSGAPNPGGVAGAAGPDTTGLPQGGAPQQTDLGKFSSVLRTALNEAGADRIKARAQQMSAGGFQPKTPGTLGAVSEILRAGVETPIESVYSDTVSLLKEKLKAAEVNPAQFKTVRGGIYDIKNNTWVVPPEPGSGGSKSGKRITRADTTALKLPVSFVGMTWEEFQEMVDSPVAPEWVREMVTSELQNKKKQSRK